MLSSVTTANMNAYSEVAAISYADHTTIQGFVLAPEDTWPPQIYTEMHPGPWGWQWKDGVRDLVLVPPSPTRITIKALMGDIKKNAPGVHRTVTDLAYSRSPECPFIVDEPSMAVLRGRIHKYENENTLLSSDAQTGFRKSVVATLGERKGSAPSGMVHAVVYPYSVDAEGIVDGLCGPRSPFENSPACKFDVGSGTMSMDLGTEDDAPSTPSELPPPSKVVGSKIWEATGADMVDGSPGRRL